MQAFCCPQDRTSRRPKTMYTQLGDKMHATIGLAYSGNANENLAGPWQGVYTLSKQLPSG